VIFDPLYWLVIGAGMLLSLWASVKVKGTFAKYSRMPTSARMTGADVARQILARNHISDVQVDAHSRLDDRPLRPAHKVLRLSEPVFGSSSMAAVGVAAHEVGHAIQHARGVRTVEAPLGRGYRWPTSEAGCRCS